MREVAAAIEERREQRDRATGNRIQADGGDQVEDRAPPMEWRQLHAFAAGLGVRRPASSGRSALSVRAASGFISLRGAGSVCPASTCLPKIIRPAVVCRTLVTTMSRFRPMRLRA